ncbi:hypothetical protein GCM10010297_46320 [Streptomyces malachitofuscus]|nr:hypothetical protein GCM10010297_46320 [Streptomyces malachitofuscus]
MGGSLAELAQAMHMHASCVDVSYRELLEHIDDLYYPGMDDLLIIEERQGVQRVLLLDHEERLHMALEGLMQDSE